MVLAKPPGPPAPDRPSPAPAAPRRDYSSPACLAHEVDPAYGGYLTDGELAAALSGLRGRELAGRKLIERLRAEEPSPELCARLAALDEAGSHSAALLGRLLERLGGTPRECAGELYDEASRLEGMAARLAFLDQARDETMRRLELLLPQVRDDEIHAALRTILQDRKPTRTTPAS